MREPRVRTSGVEQDGWRLWRRIALAGAVVTYLLIVLGGVVRITGSGLGCGDDWPLCNGRLIPPMDLATWIEYGHRLVAVAVSILVLALVSLAGWRGRREAWRSRRRRGALALGILVVQVLLGAITVWLGLPPVSVILHLAAAMSLLAVLILAAAEGYGDRGALRRVSDGAARLAWMGVGLGFVVVLLGALVANLDAALVCHGFPLCNARWLPSADWRIQLHWTHRTLAYLLVAWTLALPGLARRRRPFDGAALRAAWVTAALGLGQLTIAGFMILRFLPGDLRAAHVAAGTALVAALLVQAWLMARPEKDSIVRSRVRRSSVATERPVLL